MPIYKEIMKNFIFAYILFALLLAVKTASFKLNKRDITFGPCDTADPVDLINVKLGTDPPESKKNESFDVFGKTKYDISYGSSFLLIAYYDKDGGELDTPYVQAINNSTKAGTPFNISASDVPTPELSDSYLIKVVISDPNVALYPFFACALAHVGGSSEKSKLF
ncbi:hypothetical protein C2G38_2145311 [Gigaspora rosea]|uniref:MD-2-related lipid-recognition domain-containing protein n=1 Tax=Gigaspora rosea TaxID=44941 RepID=A0A397UNY9_9GLOM|nr:hypothetical protein C2G38_2145311 [Gigaspora rosea]